MNTEAEIRVKGMQAWIGALGLVDAERRKLYGRHLARPV
jgi:hypothetical protein